MEKKASRRMVIERSQVQGSRLLNFEVLVEFDIAELSGGGEKRQIAFFADDGVTPLAHELAASTDKVLRAWVMLPELANAADTVIYSACCEHGSDVTLERDDCLVLHGPATSQEVTPPAALNGATSITVEAWVEAEHPRAEALQALASRWRPRSEFGDFAAYDAGRTSGLDTTGYFGGVFDGRYLYFAPQHDLDTRHGKVLRYDTHADFHDSPSWLGYDAGRTDGLTTHGFYGAVFDGRYVYFVPRRSAEAFHTHVLRYDTHGDFTEASSWEAYDVGMPRSYQSAAFDGHYIYFCPGHVAIHKDSVETPPDCDSPRVTGMSDDYYLAGNSIVLRFDTQGEFKSESSWSTYDAGNTSGLNTSDYDGGCYDGRYIYFVPLSTGAVLRYDTAGDFADPGSWRAFDARPLGIEMCVGAVFDGNFIYLVPYGVSKTAVRFDTRGTFEDTASWSTYEMMRTEGLAAVGFDGGLFDGRYIYFVPYYDGKDFFHGLLLRYDTTQPFEAATSWSVHDAGEVEGLRTVGFNGALSDGRYFYFVPWQDGGSFPGRIVGNGRVLRYDTTGDEAAFSLRFVDYGHNGGLTAAVPGTRFIINTDHGPFTVASNRTPEAGRHHIAGVYDGSEVRLYIDGELVGRGEARGRLSTSEVPISIGHVEGGQGTFEGAIEELRIATVARDESWIRTRANNLADPRGFCRLVD